MSAANLLEAGIVADDQTDPRTGRQLDALVANFRLRIAPASEEQVRIARQAYADLGRGNHPAGLDFGDCFAYALAKASGEPLLFKGDDFGHTDIPGGGGARALSRRRRARSEANIASFLGGCGGPRQPTAHQNHERGGQGP